MDFTTMKRKELQSLCKKHGIPANLSNAEMAKRISSLLEVKEKKKAKSCLRSVNNEVDNVDEESKKVGKRVKFSPENETFEFEKTDPRACRLLARKRRATMNPKIEADPGSVFDNVKNPVGNSRNSKRKTMINVKVDEGLVSEDVGKVEKSLEGGNIGRNLRSRVKKMTKGEEDSTLVSPCIERRAKRGRKGSQVDGVENKVSVINETENGVVVIRKLRNREVRVEILRKGDDDFNEKSENVMHFPRRSYRQTNKGKDDESDQDVVKNQPQCVDGANLSVIVEKDCGIKEMSVSEKSTRRGKELTKVDASLSESMLDEIVPRSSNEHVDEGEKETVLENEKPEVEVQIHETGSAISVEEKEEKCESIVPVSNSYVVEPDCGSVAKCTTPCSSGAVNINASVGTKYDPKKEGVGNQSATPKQNLEVGSSSKNHDKLNAVDSQYTDSCESSPKSMTINVSYLFSNSQVDEQFNTDEEKSEPENVTEPNCSIITNPTSPRSNKVDDIDRGRDKMENAEGRKIVDHYIPVEKVEIALDAGVEENIQTLIEDNEGTKTTTPSQNLGGGSRFWDNQESSEAFSGSSSMNISSLFRSSPIKEQCLVNDDYNVIEKSEETCNENIQLSEESPMRLNLMSGIVSTPLSTHKRNFSGTPLNLVAPERSRDCLSCVDASIPICTSTQKLNILESSTLHLGLEGSIVESGFSFESKLEDCSSSFEKSGDEILIAVDQGEEPEPKDGQGKDQWKEPEPNDGQVEDQWKEPEPNDGQVEAKKPEPKGDQVVHHAQEPEPNDGQVEAIKPEPKGDQVVHHEKEPEPKDGQVEAIKPEPKGDQMVHHEQEPEPNDGQVEAKKPEPKGSQVVHHEQEPQPKVGQVVNHEKEPEPKDGQVEVQGKEPEPKVGQVVNQEKEHEPNESTKIGDPSAETGAEPPIVMEKGVETDSVTPHQNWETEFRSINEDARYTFESQATDLDSFPNINTRMLLSHSPVDDELTVSQGSPKKGEKSEGETMRNLSCFDNITKKGEENEGEITRSLSCFNNITKKGEESGGEIVIDFSCFDNITIKGEENEGEITRHDEIDEFTPTLPTKTVDIQASALKSTNVLNDVAIYADYSTNSSQDKEGEPSKESFIVDTTAFGDKPHTMLKDDRLTEENDNVACSYAADNAVECVFGSEYENTSEDKGSDTPKRACLGDDKELCWNTSVLKEDNRDCEGDVKSIDNVNSPFQSANDKSLIEVVTDKTEVPWRNAFDTKCLSTPEPGKAQIDHAVEKSEVSGCRDAWNVVERISGFDSVESEKFNTSEGVLEEFAGDEGNKIVGQPDMNDSGYEGLSSQTPGDGRGSLRGINVMAATPERIDDGLCGISEAEGNPDHENSTESCIFSKWELDFIYGEMAKEMNESTQGSSEKSTSKNKNDQTNTDDTGLIHETEVVNPSSSIIESNVERSILINGTPKKPVVFTHDMKENAPSAKMVKKVVDLTAVKPIGKRKALGVVGK